MIPEPVVFTSSQGLSQRLLELGLSRELLEQIVRAGAQERRRSTKLHPRNHAGFNDWSGCIAEARRLLVPEGWRSEDVDGLPLVVHPRNLFAFTVATGDGATGDPSRTPSTKYSKGAKTIKEVARNQQPSLPGLEPPAPRSPRDFWILLRARHGSAIHLEFSKPSTFSELNGGRAFVTGWSERLVVEPVAASRAVPDELIAQTTGEIEIQIDKL